ncbi:MAG: alanine racemase, partial [Bdellovibrionales bacterium]|nr:alanine racemase [Bdellovibrionales bacterium]
MSFPAIDDLHLKRPTIIDINLDALCRNFLKIAQHVGRANVMPILKANAYGCGLIPCAKALQNAGAKSFGVALLQEAVDLRRAGISIPILVLGGLLGGQIDHYLHYDLDMTASSVFK